MSTYWTFLSLGIDSISGECAGMKLSEATLSCESKLRDDSTEQTLETSLLSWNIFRNYEIMKTTTNGF